MGLYKREGSPNWYYKFKVKGRTFRGSTETANKADAQRIEVDERRKVLAPPEAKRNEYTLGAAADAWFEDEGKLLADADNNQSRIRKLFGERIVRPGYDESAKRYGLSRDLLLHELTNEDITKVVRARRKEGNKSGTINREIALVQSIVRHARVKLNARVPEIDFGEFRGDEGQGRLRFLALEEELALLDDLNPATRYKPEAWLQLPLLLKTQQQDQYDLAVFLLDTGGRYGEGAGVMWDVADFERRTINVFRDKVGNEGTLAMTDRLNAVLLRRWNSRDPNCPWIFPGRDPSKARGYATDGIRKAMDRVGINSQHKVARFGRATPAHTLRHTFASRLVIAGVSLYKVSKLLGHSSIKTTEIYAHLAPCDAADEAAAVLNRIHAPKPMAGVVQLSGPHDNGGSTGAQKVSHEVGAQQEVTVRRVS
jgi:integrase